jgi:Na+-transporting NADH:ubiquinone oxidoreductase subunit NqrF
MNKPRKYRSKVIEQLQQEYDNLHWYKKLKKRFSTQRWVWACRTRFIWDLNYERNIFKRKFGPLK